MKGIKKLYSAGKSKQFAITLDFGTKYVSLIPSIATVYQGHIWPIGISFKFLYFGISIVYVGK